MQRAADVNHGCISTFLEQALISLEPQNPKSSAKAAGLSSLLWDYNIPSLMMKELHVCRDPCRINTILLIISICPANLGQYSLRFPNTGKSYQQMSLKNGNTLFQGQCS